MLKSDIDLAYTNTQTWKITNQIKFTANSLMCVIKKETEKISYLTSKFLLIMIIIPFKYYVFCFLTSGLHFPIK